MVRMPTKEHFSPPTGQSGLAGHEVRLQLIQIVNQLAEPTGASPVEIECQLGEVL